MIKKNLILLGAAALTASTVAAAGFSSYASDAHVSKLLAGDSVQWNHYSAVEPTLDQRGIKEYWVSCGTHESVFEAPVSGNIVDKGQPSQAFIDSLESNDSRLLAKTWQVISFENESDINLVASIRNNFNSKEVVDTSGATDGTHALKLKWKDNTAEFYVVKSYLDKAFADPNVTAVKFDAKGNAPITGFQYITNTTGAAGDVTANYESKTDAGFGLTTEWKTFSWTRDLYNNLVNYPIKYSSVKHCFMWEGLSTYGISYGDFEFYLDNIRPVYDSDTVCGFEGGRLVSNSSAPDYRDFNGKQMLVVEFQTAKIDQYSYGFDYTYKTEGNKSIKIHKPYEGYVFFKSVTMRDTLTGDDDYFTVDIRATSAFNSYNSNKGVRDGNDVPFFNASSGQMEGNRWVRLVVKKTNLNNATFLKFTASTQCDLYIDNIQYHAGDDTSFEGNCVYLDSGYYYYRGASTKLGDSELINSAFSMQNTDVGYVAISKTRATDGSRSFMMTKTGTGETPIFFGKVVKDYLVANPTKTLSIDIWTSNRCTQMRNGRSSKSDPELVRTLEATTPYAWKTYELTADDLTDDGRGLILSGSSTLGDWYIDNIVIS